MAGTTATVGTNAQVDSNGFDWKWWGSRIVPQLLAGYQRFTGHNQFVLELGAKLPIVHYVMRESPWKFYAPLRFHFDQGSKSVEIPGLDATSKRRDWGGSLGFEARRAIGKSAVGFTLGAGIMVAKISSPCDPRFSQAEQDEIDAAGEGIRGFEPGGYDTRDGSCGLEADGAVLPREGLSGSVYASAGLDYRFRKVSVGLEGRVNPQFNSLDGQSADDPSISELSLLNGALLARLEYHFDEPSGVKKAPKKEPPVTDKDNDGIADAQDTCPTEAEDVDNFQDNDGCPDPDNDGDNVLDPDDKCPSSPGTAANSGCQAAVETSPVHEGIAMEDAAFEQ